MFTQSNYPTFKGLAYTPEPASLLMLGLGAVMLRRRKRGK
ncbi:MAG: PEP-CTERM sorting domain-containing protein [Planctomycetota bacterium]